MWNRFPDRVLPNADQKLVRNLRNFGSYKKPIKTAREIRHEGLKLNVLLHVEKNPNKSTSQIAHHLQVVVFQQTVNIFSSNINLFLTYHKKYYSGHGILATTDI
jgi:hypothetical protein